MAFGITLKKKKNLWASRKECWLPKRALVLDSNNGFWP